MPIDTDGYRNVGPNHWNADMTLEEALYILRNPWACACTGPPWVQRNGRLRPPPPGTPCHCALVVGQALALHRAAHIAVKLIADHHLWRSLGEWTN